MSFYGPEDQVVRLENFKREHPSVSISHNRRAREWDASWNGKSGTRRITHQELKNLLDTLEQELG